MTTDIYQPAAPLSSDTAASLSAIFPLYDEYAKYIADGFLIAPDPQHYPDPQPEPTALINEVVIWLMCGCETFVVVDPRPQFHDFVTVLTAEGGKRLTKLVYRPEGSADLATQAYDNAFMFRYQQRQITSLRQLKTLIEGLAYDQAIIPGWLLDGCDPAQPQRRLVHEKDGAHPTLRDVAHIWMVVDADNLPAVDADGEFDPVLYPERAARSLSRARRPLSSPPVAARVPQCRVPEAAERERWREENRERQAHHQHEVVLPPIAPADHGRDAVMDGTCPSSGFLRQRAG